MSVICYEILNDGEGERGRVLVFPPDRQLCHAYQYAMSAAREFDDWEMREGGLADPDMAGASRVIEVVGFSDRFLLRYRVRCKVRRDYHVDFGVRPGAVR